MDGRDRLVREEAEGWSELRGLIARVSPQWLEEPGLTDEGWTVKDLLWHLSRWWTEAADRLERIRLGTYAEGDVPEDEMNARFLEEGRELALSEVETELLASRSRALEELAALPTLPAPAVEWFEETGALHYREHLKDLRRWIDGLATA